MYEIFSSQKDKKIAPFYSKNTMHNQIQNLVDGRSRPPSKNAIIHQLHKNISFIHHHHTTKKIHKITWF